MRNYIKQKETIIDFETIITVFLASKIAFIQKHKRIFISLLCTIFVLPVLVLAGIQAKKMAFSTVDKNTEIPFNMASLTEVQSKKSVLNVQSGIVNSNPFLPYREVGSSVPKVDLEMPPEAVAEQTDAIRVMDTTISGILYDKYSPSAILNIEGTDYLVKKGDIVNNYKIVNITRDSVTVKLGNNVYKAGIGEMLTDGSVQYNNISNLNNKFGGKK